MARKRNRSPQPVVDRWPCVFREAFIREIVDPRVAELWMSTYHTKAPFGELRRIWKTRHCRALNPGGSDTCRYTVTECSMAFLVATQKSVSQSHPKPMGYYRALVATMADMRADRRPLAREARPRYEQDSAGGSLAGHGGITSMGGGAGSVQPGNAPDVLEETSLHRSHARPESIGTLLRSLDIGPRKVGTENGKEGAKR